MNSFQKCDNVETIIILSSSFPQSYKLNHCELLSEYETYIAKYISLGGNRFQRHIQNPMNMYDEFFCKSIFLKKGPSYFKGFEYVSECDGQVHKHHV